MNHQQDLSPAEVYERYLSRTIADPWTRVLLNIAAPEIGEQALDLPAVRVASLGSLPP